MAVLNTFKTAKNDTYYFIYRIQKKTQHEQSR